MGDKDESVAKTVDREAVAKCDFHVDRIKVTVICLSQRLSLFSLGDCSERPKGRVKLAAIHPLTIMAHLKHVFDIVELTAPHNAVKLLQRPTKFSVGAVGGVTRANSGRRRALMMDMLKHFIPLHSQEKGRLVGLDISC